MAQKGAKVTAISGSSVILDIVYNTITKINQNSMPWYDIANPKFSICEMVGQKDILREKSLQPNTTNKDLDQFI